MAKVNIVVPYYNNPLDDFKKLVFSLEGQCYKDFTVTVVFDGDSDSFKKVQKEYYNNEECLTEFPLFLELLKENKGASYARNYGAKISGESICPKNGNSLSGEILFFIDADCQLRPGMLRECVDQLDINTDVDFVYGNYLFGDTEQRHVAKEFCSYELETMNYISTMSPVRRRAFNKVKGFNTSLPYFQDWDLFYRISKNGNGGKYINENIFITSVPKEGDISSIKDTLSNKAKTFRKSNKIEDKELVVTSFGASYQALQRAKMLGADYIHAEAVPRLNYDNWKGTYMVGLFNETAQAFNNHLMHMIGKKIFHFIGTDAFQLYNNHSTLFLDAFYEALQKENATIFANSPRLLKELKRCGFEKSELLYSPIYNIDQYKSTKPLPKEFTVGVYFTDSNPMTMLHDKTGLSNIPMIVDVASQLPHIKFKFFGGREKYSHKTLDKPFPDNIEFCGRIKENEMVDFINSCSCILRSTIHDGFPQSPIHFMLCGRQAIVSCPDDELKYSIKLKYEDILENIDDAKKDMVDCIKQAYDNPDALLNKTDEIKKYYGNLMSVSVFNEKIYGVLNEN